MSAGAIGMGFAGALANYLQQERQRNRESEDNELSQHMQLIQTLASRPDANPALLGQAIHDMMDMQAAKGGRGKLKGGAAGVMGAHELPVSQFLQGFSDGSRPITGPTMQNNPEQPSEGMPQALQRMPQAPAQTPPFSTQPGQLTGQATSGQPQATAAASLGSGAPTGGRSVLAAPIAMPPIGAPVPAEAARLVEAGRGMQLESVLSPPPPMAQKPVPQGQQPYFRAPEEMAQQSANLELMKDTAKEKGKLAAEMEGYKEMSRVSGIPLAEIVSRSKNLSAPPKGPTAAKQQLINATINGTPGQAVWIDPTTRIIHRAGTDEVVTGEVQLEAKPGSAASQPFDVKTFQNQDGQYIASWIPKTPPITKDIGVQGIVTAPTGIKGKLPNPPRPPQPQLYVYDTTDPTTGRPVPTAVDKRDLLQKPGAAPLPKNQKLQTEEQTFIDTAQGTQGTLDKIQKSIEAEGLQNANSMADWGSQATANWWRRQGFEPDKLHADLQQRVGYIKATLLRSLLGGRPNKQITEIFSQHLPAEFQTPAQMYNTIKLIKQEVQDRYNGIQAGHGGQPLPKLGEGDQDFKAFIDALRKK